jgi:cytochrome c-type biogenesis protein CcmH
MSPQMKLSFPSVIVGARISRTGDAMPRTGDLLGQVGPVDVGSGKLVLMIDGVVP